MRFDNDDYEEDETRLIIAIVYWRDISACGDGIDGLESTDDAHMATGTAANTRSRGWQKMFRRCVSR